MNFDFSNFDLSNLPIPMPTLLDMGHVGLGVLAILFLLIAILRGGAKQAQSDNGKGHDDVSHSSSGKTPAQLRDLSPDAALQMLTLLQTEARFIDFVKEDLTGFSDADIGAAARVVHEGSQKALNEYFVLEAILSEEEESQVTLEAGFNASEIRLTGNVVGEAPFKGTVVHRGWRAVEVKLPKLSEGHDAKIIAPSEVEL